MTSTFSSAVPVWVVAVVGAVLVAVLTVDAEASSWLALVFAGCVLLTFAIQLGLRKSQGFVSRAMASIVGALIVLAMATLLVRLIG